MKGMKKTSQIHSRFFRRNFNVTVAEVSSFIAEFSEESDRGLVVLGVIRLDELLKELISKMLRPAPKKKDKRGILDEELRDFASRIKACYEFGLIDRECMDVLDQLRRIRNDFAHNSDSSLVGGSSDSRIKKVEETLRRIHLYTTVKEILQNEKPQTKFEKPLRLTLESILCFLIIILNLHLRLKVKPVWQFNRTLSFSLAESDSQNKV